MQFEFTAKDVEVLQQILFLKLKQLKVKLEGRQEAELLRMIPLAFEQIKYEREIRKIKGDIENG